MDYVVQMGLLYDFYGGLLTRKQKKVFGLYYLENLSLAEIAEEEGTTRQAVHDLLRRTEKRLVGWESKLGLVDRYLREFDAVQEVERAIRALENLLPVDEQMSTAFAQASSALSRLLTILELETEKPQRE